MNLLAKYVLPYLKGHVAGLGAAASAVLADANGNFNNLGAVSNNQWIAAVILALGVGGFVAAVPNTPAPAPFAPANAGAPEAPVTVVAPVAQDA